MSQKVVITAGAGGIGWAIAQTFLADGAKVHLSDVDADALQQRVEENENVTGSVGDVASVDDVAQLVRDAQSNLGGVDVLVSNAGISGPTAPVEEYDPDGWDAVMKVNLDGSFNVVRQFVPALKESRAGSVLVMSSLAGRFGYPNRIAYSTTKWGLVGFTRTLSQELGPYGITVNSIHPGAVNGPRIERVFQGRAEQSGRTVEEEKELALANQSIKAFTEPADIGALAFFLAGPHARTISGQQISIDGDSKTAQ